MVGGLAGAVNGLRAMAIGALAGALRRHHLAEYGPAFLYQSGAGAGSGSSPQTFASESFLINVARRCIRRLTCACAAGIAAHSSAVHDANPHRTPAFGSTVAICRLISAIAARSLGRMALTSSSPAIS